MWDERRRDRWHRGMRRLLRVTLVDAARRPRADGLPVPSGAVSGPCAMLWLDRHRPERNEKNNPKL